MSLSLKGFLELWNKMAISYKNSMNGLSDYSSFSNVG